MAGMDATTIPNMVAEPGFQQEVETRFQNLLEQTEAAFKNLETILNIATDNKIQTLNENLQEK